MRAALALVLSGTLVLAACGDDSDSSDAEDYAETPVAQILEDAKDAMGDLKSVRMSGTAVEDGEQLELDVTVSTSGECEGSVAMNGQGSIELLQVDGVSYFKAEEEFWRAQGGEAADQLMTMAGDKWVTSSEDPIGFGELCDLDNFIDALDRVEQDMKLEGTEEIDGTDAVRLSYTSDDGDPGVVYIAADDPHRILRIHWQDNGQVGFTDFDEELSVEKPSPDDVFDVATLG